MEIERVVISERRETEAFFNPLPALALARHFVHESRFQKCAPTLRSSAVEIREIETFRSLDESSRDGATFLRVEIAGTRVVGVL